MNMCRCRLVLCVIIQMFILLLPCFAFAGSSSSNAIYYSRGKKAHLNIYFGSIGGHMMVVHKNDSTDYTVKIEEFAIFDGADRIKEFFISEVISTSTKRNAKSSASHQLAAYNSSDLPPINSSNRLIKWKMYDEYYGGVFYDHSEYDDAANVYRRRRFYYYVPSYLVGGKSTRDEYMNNKFKSIIEIPQ